MLLVPYALVPLYRAVDPVSTLMLWRWAKRARVERLVVPIDRMTPILPRSVIAAEDDRFCSGGKYDPASSPRRAEPPPRYITATINRHDGPEDGGLSERCLTGGLPEFGTAFGGSFRRIVQTPGGISMFYDVGRGQGWQRNIVMNGSPHLPANIRQWYGDSAMPQFAGSPWRGRIGRRFPPCSGQPPVAPA